MMVVQKMTPMSVSNVTAVQVRDILNYPLVALMRTTTIMKRTKGPNGQLGHPGEHVTVRVVMGNKLEHVRVPGELLDRVHVQEMDGKMSKTANLENVQHGENGEDGLNVTRLVTPANRIVLLLDNFYQTGLQTIISVKIAHYLPLAEKWIKIIIAIPILITLLVEKPATLKATKRLTVLVDAIVLIATQPCTCICM